MRPDASLLLVLLLPVVLTAVIALVVYGVVRLAVRHGSLDARRRWRQETAGDRPSRKE